MSQPKGWPLGESKTVQPASVPDKNGIRSNDLINLSSGIVARRKLNGILKCIGPRLSSAESQTIRPESSLVAGDVTGGGGKPPHQKPNVTALHESARVHASESNTDRRDTADRRPNLRDTKKTGDRQRVHAEVAAPPNRFDDLLGDSREGAALTR